MEGSEFHEGSAKALREAPAPLSLQAAFLRIGSRPGFLTDLRFHCRLADQVDEPIKSVLPVAFLGAKAAGIDDQYTVPRKPPAGKVHKTAPHILRNRWRPEDIESELHRGSDLINILATRSRSPDEFDMDLVFADGQAWSNLNHIFSLIPGNSNGKKRLSRS